MIHFTFWPKLISSIYFGGMILGMVTSFLLDIFPKIPANYVIGFSVGVWLTACFIVGLRAYNTDIARDVSFKYRQSILKLISKKYPSVYSDENFKFQLNEITPKIRRRLIKPLFIHKNLTFEHIITGERWQYMDITKQFRFNYNNSMDIVAFTRYSLFLLRFENGYPKCYVGQMGGEPFHQDVNSSLPIEAMSILEKWSQMTLETNGTDLAICIPMVDNDLLQQFIADCHKIAVLLDAKDQEAKTNSGF